MKFLLFSLVLCFASCSLLQNNQVMYRAGKTLPDTTYVYALPFEKGKAYRVAQGSHSFFSHFGDFAVDFKMKPGTPIHAARGGVVVFERSFFTNGGITRKFRGKGNGITISHGDDTYAHYWHLRYNGSVVRVGDTVTKGQLIGYSGSTGFSAFPHLHFEVTERTRIGGKELPVVFQTEEGARFLQPLRRYKAE
ncbi:M23 family metallopeptidase [Flavisolibacter sp. BT320]|nr:M23 family metallopeptidase [Flavisolibacter longurius]